MSSMNVALWFGASLTAVAAIGLLLFVILKWTELTLETKIIFVGISFLLAITSVIGFLIITNTFPFTPYLPEDPRDLRKKPIDSWLDPEFNYTPYLEDTPEPVMQEIIDRYP